MKAVSFLFPEMSMSVAMSDRARTAALGTS